MIIGYIQEVLKCKYYCQQYSTKQLNYYLLKNVFGKLYANANSQNKIYSLHFDE